MVQIHPAPYGSSLSRCGASASSELTSTTVPATGEYTSETDLVDSTSLQAPPASTTAPTSGNCTNTTSPRASWAYSVMPIRTRPPSSMAHSWSLVYRLSSGTFMAPDASAQRDLAGT